MQSIHIFESILAYYLFLQLIAIIIELFYFNSYLFNLDWVKISRDNTLKMLHNNINDVL